LIFIVFSQLLLSGLGYITMSITPDFGLNYCLDWLNGSTS